MKTRTDSRLGRGAINRLAEALQRAYRPDSDQQTSLTQQDGPATANGHAALR
jgi:hypothetical protein